MRRVHRKGYLARLRARPDQQRRKERGEKEGELAVSALYIGVDPFARFLLQFTR